jgi:hypothetical protein
MGSVSGAVSDYSKLVDDDRRTSWGKLSNFIENTLSPALMVLWNDFPIHHHTGTLSRPILKQNISELRLGYIHPTRELYRRILTQNIGELRSGYFHPTRLLAYPNPVVGIIPIIPDECLKFSYTRP